MISVVCPFAEPGMERQMSARTAAATSVGGLCAVVVGLIPNVLLAVYMLQVVGEVEKYDTCLAPYQKHDFDAEVGPLAGDLNPNGGNPSYGEAGEELVNEEWTELVHYLKLYASFQLFTSAAMALIFVGMVGVLVCEMDVCGCLTLLGGCGACCMAIPSLVIMVRFLLLLLPIPLASALCAANHDSISRRIFLTDRVWQVLLLVQWTAVSDACNGNYVYEKESTYAHTPATHQRLPGRSLRDCLCL